MNYRQNSIKPLATKIKIAMGPFVPVELHLSPDPPWTRSSQLRHSSPAHGRYRPRAARALPTCRRLRVGYLRCLAASYPDADVARGRHPPMCRPSPLHGRLPLWVAASIRALRQGAAVNKLLWVCAGGAVTAELSLPPTTFV